MLLLEVGQGMLTPGVTNIHLQVFEVTHLKKNIFFLYHFDFSWWENTQSH